MYVMYIILRERERENTRAACSHLQRMFWQVCLSVVQQFTVERKSMKERPRSISAKTRSR